MNQKQQLLQFLWNYFIHVIHVSININLYIYIFDVQNVNFVTEKEVEEGKACSNSFKNLNSNVQIVSRISIA